MKGFPVAFAKKAAPKPPKEQRQQENFKKDKDADYSFPITHFILRAKRGCVRRILKAEDHFFSPAKTNLLFETNMRTALYINDSFCSSLEQLRGFFSMKLIPGSPLYENLLIAQRDGELAKWLSEGTTEEQSLAILVKNIPTDLSNSDLMEQLVSVFNNRSIQIEKPTLINYIDVEHVSFIVDKQKFGLGNGEITIESVQVSSCFAKVELKIKKVDNEKFTLKLFDKDTKSFSECELGLINHSVGEIVTIDIPLPNVEKGVHHLVLISGLDVFSSFSLNVTLNETVSVKGVRFKMVHVEGGNCEWNKDKTIPDFKIGETPVTQALWNAVMESNPSYHCKKNMLTPKSLFSKFWSFFTTYDYNPVESVSLYDCKNFICKLNELTGMNFRLPTVDEWKFAAYGGNMTKHFMYSGSNCIDEVAWYEDNSEGHTHSVKGKLPNELGLYDMSGNVKELCNNGTALGGAYNTPSVGCILVHSWIAMPLGIMNRTASNPTPNTCSETIGFRLAL